MRHCTVVSCTRLCKVEGVMFVMFAMNDFVNMSLLFCNSLALRYGYQKHLGSELTCVKDLYDKSSLIFLLRLGIKPIAGIQREIKRMFHV